MAKRMRLTPPRPDYLALRDVADAFGAARAEGRLVQNLPLEAVEVDHLVRDRMAADGEEMAVLRDSLRARGQ